MPSRTQFGHPVLGVTELLTLATLAAIDVTENIPYQEFKLNDGSVAGSPPLVYYYHPTSVLAADNVFVIAPTAGAGRYLLAPSRVQNILLPIGFGTADAAVLVTLPTNALALVRRGYWVVGTGFTGGTSSAIGLSSTNATGFTTKGDIQGGASGDVAATLVAGTFLGTIGAKIAAGVLLKGGNTLRFDQVTSTFTAGAGFVGVVMELLANPGV